MRTTQGIAPIAMLIIALLVIGGGAYGVKKLNDKKVGKENQPAENENVPGKSVEETKKPTTLQVKLNEQNASGQGGQAVLVEVGTSTLRVIVNLAGKPSSVPQPAHIHLGACPNPGAVKYPLTDVGNGASQTDIPNLTLEELLLELPLAINVHKSAADLKAYVACGDILRGDANATSTSDAGGAVKKETKVTYNAQGFSPKTVTIKKGETVVFENKTGKSASIASDEHPTHLLYPEFDQYKTDARGQTEFKFTFEKAGTWKYHDHLNASMVGTVIVTE